MQITPPFGYDEIIPLQKKHRVLMAAGTTPAFCRKLNALALSAVEFSVAARDYPIVFTSLDGGASYAPVIVLGLAEASNLFISAAGEWDPAVYLPAFVRRYPFCISKLHVDGKPSGERVVCVAKAWVDDAGIQLFDASGAPTPQWQHTERLLTEYERDLDFTAGMCAALARLKLLEPFSMEIVRDGKSGFKLAGMYRVGEALLNDLKPASHKVLVTKGYMSRIYAHIHSLENFQRLYARQVAAQQRAAEERRA